MEAPEYYENVRLADVFARDASHVRTMALIANAIALGLGQVASRGTFNTQSTALMLAANLRELGEQLQSESNDHRARSAAA